MIFDCLSMMDDEAEKLNFESVYRKYADGIFRRTYKILKNQQDTEDAMQETWIKIMENIDVLRGKSERTVRAYIMKIAKNEAISMIRKKGKEETMLCAIEDADIACEEELFEACEACDIADIKECFAELGETYRDVLSLYYFYHHSIKEIAKIMNMKEATVNSRLTRGRGKLIEILKRRGYCEK